MYNIANAKKIIKALIEAGASPTILPFLICQVAHETGDFDSRVFRLNKNASGIMFINKPLKQKNASKGLAYPSREGRYFYANFATLKDWAIDYLRVIGRTPQSAKNLTDYANKLRARGYYTDTASNYAKALESHRKQLIKAGLLSKPQTADLGAGGIIAVLIVAVGLFLIKSV
jgi:hypothetical protein